MSNKAKALDLKANLTQHDNLPALIVGVALVVRLLALWIYQQVHDSHIVWLPTFGAESGKVAYSIATGKGFTGLWFGLNGPTAWMPPVYPYLLAGVYKLSGMNDSTARILAQLMNLVFSAATCWPLYSLGRKIFSVRVGSIAAWIWAFLPLAIQIPMEWIWDQSLDALLLCCLLLLSLKLREESSTLSWTGFGLLWAFVAMINPSLCILLPFFLSWIVVQRRKIGLPSLQLVERTVLFFVLALLPWTVRNYRAMNAVVPMKSNFGLELWLGNNPAVKHVWAPELHPQSNPVTLTALIQNGEIEFNRLKQREALDFIVHNPGTFVRLTLGRVLDTWTSWYESENELWVRALGLRWRYVFFYSLFSVLAFAGTAFALRAKIEESKLLVYCLLLFPAVYYITHSNAHYRHAIDPVLTLFTAYCLIRLSRARQVASQPTPPL